MPAGVSTACENDSSVCFSNRVLETRALLPPSSQPASLRKALAILETAPHLRNAFPTPTETAPASVGIAPRRILVVVVKKEGEEEEERKTYCRDADTAQHVIHKRARMVAEDHHPAGDTDARRQHGTALVAEEFQSVL